MKIDILNSTQSFSWDGIEVPMVQIGYWNKMKIAQFCKQERNFEADSKAETIIARQIEEAYAMRNIVAAKYEPIKLTKVMNKQSHFTIPEQSALEKNLQSHLAVFQGLRSNWKGKPVHLDFYQAPNHIVRGHSRFHESVRN